MSEHVTPLRQPMIDDMAIRNMSTGTQQAYVRVVTPLVLPWVLGLAGAVVDSAWI
jgi:hypothetical protein